jgi:hypothetical protein
MDERIWIRREMYHLDNYFDLCNGFIFTCFIFYFYILFLINKVIEDETPFLAAAKKPDSPLKKIMSTMETLKIMWHMHDRPKDDPAYKHGLPVSIFFVFVVFCFWVGVGLYMWFIYIFCFFSLFCFVFLLTLIVVYLLSLIFVYLLSAHIAKIQFFFHI